jgi:rhodanese-related sulfurtransferase
LRPTAQSIREEKQLPGSSKFPLLTGSQAVQEQAQGALLLDTRPPERFASFHIRGAVQISLAGRFASWAALLIKPAQTIVLVAETFPNVEEAYTRLTRVGLGHVIGYVLADERQWRKEGLALAGISMQQCANIRHSLEGDEAVQLVDVRSRAEWLKGHLPGAISVPLLELDTGLQSVDLSKPSFVYCHEGYRATTAASILLRGSSANIGILIDGVEGWSALGLPFEVPTTE